jgi:hypothetical protein
MYPAALHFPASSVLVPVVRVRPVEVTVLQRLMAVHVRMPLGRRGQSPGMRMSVVLVVDVPVLVLHGDVGVNMVVPFAKKQDGPEHHQGQSEQEQYVRRLAKYHE